MPGHKMHKWFAFVSSVVFTLLLLGMTVQEVEWHWTFVLAIPVILVFATLPDLDHPMGRARKRYYQVMFIIMILGAILGMVMDTSYVLVVFGLLGIIGLFLLRLKHRGLFHKYWFLLLLSLPLIAVHWYLAMIAFVSGASHIFLDRLTTGIKRTFKVGK